MVGSLRKWAAAGVLAAISSSAAWAQEPGWSGPVIATPEQRVHIEQIDIHLRPYRPFHFYGNTVRRMYYRGNPLPTLRDLVDGSQALFTDVPPPPPPAAF